jgi:aldose 1-epimerase
MGEREIRLARNDGANHLHGGPSGFHSKKWRVDRSSAESIALSIVSPDGDEGYPGRLDVRVTYTLTPDDDLRIEYRATTDAETVINLTNHSYFNLGGKHCADVLDHAVTIAASAFTPVDSKLIPTGEVRSVAGSALDLTRPTRLGERIDADEEQIRLAGGYDHNYVLDSGLEDTPAFAARVVEPGSGRMLEVWTTEPGIQFYSGNHLDGIVGKGGRRYARRAGFCLEAQHYPDSPNQPSFPSVLLAPGETYRQITIYRLTVQ